MSALQTPSAGGAAAGADAAAPSAAAAAAECGAACAPCQPPVETTAAGGAPAPAQPSAGPAGPRQPRVASTAPIRMHVLVPDADTGAVPPCDCGRAHVVHGRAYRFCACGLSAAQPWCDDACASSDTPFRPVDTVVTEKQTYLLMCPCKRTGDPGGRCDGSHARIGWKDLEW
jgi:CDGSH iron-sulfur domain-containing protein 3